MGQPVEEVDDQFTNQVKFAIDLRHIYFLL